MIIKLKKAILHKGQELHEINIPLENLSGQDLITIEENLMRNGTFAVSEFSRVYLIAIAAKAAKIPVEVLNQMNIRDFTLVTNEVRNFLLTSDSETPETEQTEIPIENLEISSEK